ncbi:cell division protein FtsQ/DivIB [[Mycobacterium] kokjensenii]|uniref:Cell division protein FtsQ n=1 Tax=[Mycobacterium] kokjensenii TaxID=3064287 RepID=A0ABN9MXY2_9MYCO|nr:cell division protein FtsQ/DivIB [Mycolicibacter sp. MU0083]CAJ1497078.1 cell division protein FtsQ/DivIB [Mycolicibacter sp. MU0083]
MPPGTPAGVPEEPDPVGADEFEAGIDDGVADSASPDAGGEGLATDASDSTDATDGAGTVDGASSADGTAASAAEPTEVEGPRRRARRERAERRAAQARAEAIEQARRDAKRRLRAGSVEPPKDVPRGTIRGLKMVLAGFLAVVSVVGLGLILYFTPVMSVRDIEITGIETVTRDEVLSVVRVPLGTPLLQVDTGSVAERVAAIRRVAGTRVQRKYPSVLGIAVVERIPVVYKDFPDGPHLFDRDGVDFATAVPPRMLPYFDVEDPGPTDPASLAALQVMTALAPDVAGQVSRVAAQSVASVTLTLVDNRVVVWGSTDRTAEKAQKLAALLTQPGHTYDVSSPDLPTVR